MEAIKDGRAFVVDILSPVNTVFFFATGILIPVFDLLRPMAFLLAYLAAAALLFFAAVLILRWLGKPRPEAISRALVATAGVCAGLITLSAFASSAYPNGFLPSKFEGLKDVQASLLDLQKQSHVISGKLDQQSMVLADIRMGRSDDPRVTLHNMGIAWDTPSFLAASDRGDVRALELFLAGGMPVSTASGGITLPERAVMLNRPNIVEQLLVFKRFGFDLNGRAPQRAWDSPTTLYGFAAEHTNAVAAEFLRAQGADVVAYETWKAGKDAHVKKLHSGGYVW